MPSADPTMGAEGSAGTLRATWVTASAALTGGAGTRRSTATLVIAGAIGTGIGTGKSTERATVGAGVGVCTRGGAIATGRGCAGSTEATGATGATDATGATGREGNAAIAGFGGSTRAGSMRGGSGRGCSARTGSGRTGSGRGASGAAASGCNDAVKVEELGGAGSDGGGPTAGSRRSRSVQVENCPGAVVCSVGRYWPDRSARRDGSFSSVYSARSTPERCHAASASFSVRSRSRSTTWVWCLV